MNAMPLSPGLEEDPGRPAALDAGTVPCRQRRTVAGGHDWHLDEYRSARCAEAVSADRRPSQRPLALLLHGTGASSDSWHGLAQRLAPHMDIVAPDLPAHARTRTPVDAALDIDAQALALETLIGTLDREPDVLIGHSAGAVILAARAMRQAQACGQAPTRAQGTAPADLDRPTRPAAHLILLNGALLPLEGPAGWLFQPLARVSSSIGWLPRLFALRAAREPDHVRRLLRSTGSSVDDAMVARYRSLLADDVHVAGVLRMMAAWDLRLFAGRLDALRVPVHLLAGDADRTIPLRHAHRLRARLAQASLQVLPGLGHLAHEEAPDIVASAVLDHLNRSRIRS